MSSLSLHRFSMPRLLSPLHPVALRKALAEIYTTHLTRRALGRLDAHLLKDIGLEPRHVRQELARPFWAF